jgi:hypothetical protein
VIDPPDLSVFQDEPEEEVPKPKDTRRKRPLVLDENGSPMEKDWSPIPDWVTCRLIAVGASGSAFALALALGRLIRERGGENPTPLYNRRQEALACIPRGTSRGRALDQLEKAGVVKRADRRNGYASSALALWLPKK